MNPLGIGDTALKQYGRIAVDVPNGRRVHGWPPGLSGVTLTEHALRDRLAKQIKGVTEASLGYGRADVLTTDAVFEVEHHSKWRTAVRQALQYAGQTGCAPAVALFDDDVPPDAILPLYLRLRDSKPAIGLWWYWDNTWYPIRSRTEAGRIASMLRAGIREDQRRQRHEAAHVGDQAYWEAAAAADRLDRAYRRAHDAADMGAQLELPLEVSSDAA